jgi:hypothetical protein
MARDHGRIMCSIWEDHEFLKLDAAVQRTYFMFISEPSISNAGVVMLTLRRWANLAPDTPIEVLERHVQILAECRFVVVDWDTEELLVRSFIRNDGVAKQPHVLLNAVRSVRHLRSPMLRIAVGRELLRIGATELVLPKYMAEVERIMASLFPEHVDDGSTNANADRWSAENGHSSRSESQVEQENEGFPEGFSEDFKEGLWEPCGEGEGVVGTSSSVVTHLSSKRVERKPRLQQKTIDRHFDTFWAAYPRRESKQGARDKFARLLRDGMDPETLIEGARRYAAYCRKVNREREKIKHPTTWLNQGCWDDDLGDIDTVATEVKDDPRSWLLRQWETASVAEIAKRTSFRYEMPDLPRGIKPSEVEGFHFEHRQNWIKANNEAIIAELKGLPCTA